MQSAVSRGLLLVFAVLVMLLPGCPRKAPIPEPVLVPPSELSPDLRMENSLLFTVQGRELLARAVVEKQGDRLDLWLLTPTGVRLCHFHQQGDTLTRYDRTDACDLLDPRFVLQDVRWSFLQRCVDADECTVGDAAFAEVRDPVTGDVTERRVTWQGTEAVITFDEHTGADGVRHPRRVEIANSTFDYSILIQVDAYEALRKDP